MTLQEALAQIVAPTGFSSLMNAIVSGDYSGLERKESTADTPLKDAESSLEKVREAQRNCKSDYAYWGYQGEISAWEARVNLIKSAELVGAENLADIQLNAGGGVVMDECAKLSRWSQAILEDAKQRQQGNQD